MTTKITVKRSAVPGKVPSTTDLALGELALNTHDGKLFIQKNDGTASIVELGQTGPKGDTGAAGADSTVVGPKGDTGAPGADSTVPGPKGDTGLTGAPGADSTVPGPKGDKGDTGLTGAPGADSTVPGPTGPAGADSTVPGPKGDTGLTGAPGADSTVPGPTGPTGADSTVPGPKGDTGADGIQGPKGDTGATGAAGADSTVVGPKGDTGAPGADSTVPGPKGDKGDTGLTGAPGADSTVPGPTGPAGADSTVPGPAGTDGIDGAPGAKGADGAQGPQGLKGDTGDTGPKGDPGDAVSLPNPDWNATSGGAEILNKPGLATTSVTGFMSSGDKTKLDGIDSGAQVNTVLSVSGKTGAVTLTSSDVGLSLTENKSSSTIRSELTNSNVTTALGYTPVDSASVGANNGVASLGPNGKIYTSQIPSIALTDTFVVVSQADMLALSTAETGDIAIRTDLSKSFILQGSDPTVLANWKELLTPTSAVTSVNGNTGTVVLTTSNITEGSNLYYSDARARASLSVNGNLIYSPVTGLLTYYDKISSVNGKWGTVILGLSDIAGAAGLANPTFTGTPKAPTATAGTNTTQIATTAYVYAQGLTKANIISPTFTGVPLAPTAATGTNTTQIATTAFVYAQGYLTTNAVTSVAGKIGIVTLTSADVGLDQVNNTSDVNKPISTAQQNALDLKSTKLSPTFTGTPLAPTATAGTNTTQIATTAFVLANVPHGADGAQGPKGDTGLTGAPGADSTVPGPTGPAGADSTVPGPQGPKGDTGADGVQGTKGDTGNTGAPGADSTVAGPQGPQGIQGGVGPQGPKGDTGLTGAPGADSTVPGPTGPAGADGSQGPKGDTGDVGPASTVPGPKGDQGDPGNTGPGGPAGADGSIAYAYSNVAPTSPNAGDRWFDTDTGIEYVWYIDTDSAQWVSVTSASQAPTDWDATSGVSQILNKPDLSVFATISGVNSTLTDYVTTVNMNSTLTSYATNASVTASLGDIENAINILLGP